MAEKNWQLSVIKRYQHNHWWMLQQCCGNIAATSYNVVVITSETDIATTLIHVITKSLCQLELTQEMSKWFLIRGSRNSDTSLVTVLLPSLFPDIWSLCEFSDCRVFKRFTKFSSNSDTPFLFICRSELLSEF